MSQQMILNAFLMSTGHHEASWRLPESDTSSYRDVTHYQRLAQVAERGRMDSVFFADSPSIFGVNLERRPAEAIEPALLLSAMAVATERIGLIATSSTTYEEPYNLARTFASLDAISHGRAGWNVVTTADLKAGANFGFTEAPSHADRYRRAEEFLEVVLGLWGGWRDGSTVADKAAGVFHDSSKVDVLDHVGEHFRVRGPLNVGRSEQGHPVIVQAGSSVPGMALAARHAEAVFTAQPSIDDGRAFYDELKAATRRAGRNPDHVKILPGLVPILGGTEAEAKALEQQLDDLVVLDHPLDQLSQDIGIPVDRIDLDAPLPDDIRPSSDIQGNKARYELVVSAGAHRGPHRAPAAAPPGQRPRAPGLHRHPRAGRRQHRALVHHRRRRRVQHHACRAAVGARGVRRPGRADPAVPRALPRGLRRDDTARALRPAGAAGRPCAGGDGLGVTLRPSARPAAACGCR